MTTPTRLNINQLWQQTISGLSISDQQLKQLELLEVNHHLVPASISCSSGTETTHMANGVYSTEFKKPVFWQHLHGEGKITGPQDNDHYSFEVRDGNARIFFAPDIVVGRQLTIDYSPGFSVDLIATLRCTTNPNKTAAITVEGKGCIG